MTLFLGGLLELEVDANGGQQVLIKGVIGVSSKEGSFADS
jgi:hypothetical protein